MKNGILSLIIVLAFYLAVGPFMGAFTVSLVADKSFPNVFLIMGGYVLGFMPALIAGITNWFVLFGFYFLKRPKSYWSCVVVSWLAASSFVALYYDEKDWYFFLICFISTWVCAHFINEKAWLVLNDT